MGKSMRWWLMGLLVASGLVGHVAAWDIPLTVQEYGGTGRQDWDLGGIRRVTGGVPLLPGQAQRASDLRLLAKGDDGAATAVPAQFRVLARWWRQDNSIRWVLVDFAVNLKSYEQRTFYLTVGEGPAAAPEHPAKVEETDDLVVVTTGPAQFTINKKRFAFLDQVRLDADGNGTFGQDEGLLEASPDLGTVIEDTFGETYYSSEGTRSVEVLAVSYTHLTLPTN